MRRFFESVAARLREVQEVADRETQGWLRTVMSPIETQVREHQTQLKQRLDSVRRILDANESLESRIAEIERQRAEVEQRIALAEEFALQARRLLGEGETIAEVAAV
jgi:tRNA(Ser,Leu) C12 N-acetylase TAN1